MTALLHRKLMRTEAAETRSEPARQSGAREPELLEGRYQAIRTLEISAISRSELVSDLALEGEKFILKIIHHHLLENDESVRALRRAVLAARQLAHPNIRRLYDFDRLSDGRFYYTCEHVDGENLQVALAERRRDLVPFNIAIDTLYRIASALRYAHEKGVLHLDLRPANVILGQQGETKLSDFGVAPSLMSGPSATRTGGAVGEMMCHAPEQLTGGILSPATDVYAFGMLAYELLSGQPAFKTSSQLELIEHHLRSPVPPLRLRRPELPEWCELLIQDCTAKSPQDRLPDGSALFDRLDRQAAQQISATKNTFVVYFRSRIRRKSVRAKISVASAWALAFMLVLLTIQQRAERISLAATLLRLERSIGIDFTPLKACLGISGSLLEPNSLLLAVQNQDSDTVEALLIAGASPNAQIPDGRRLIDVVLAQAEYKTVEAFQKHNVDFRARDNEGNTPFLYGLKRANFRWLELAVTFKWDISTPDELGVTPLILSTQRNDYYWTAALLQAGADPNPQDKHGHSALFFAIEHGDLHQTRMLLRWGAKLDVWDENGATPLFFAIGKPILVKELIDAGANPFARNYKGETALHAAVKAGDLQSVQMMLLGHVPVHARDDSGKRPIDYARDLSASALVTLLEAYMATHPEGTTQS